MECKTYQNGLLSMLAGHMAQLYTDISSQTLYLLLGCFFLNKSCLNASIVTKTTKFLCVFVMVERSDA